jgi:hypothetical protein
MDIIKKALTNNYIKAIVVVYLVIMLVLAIDIINNVL